MKPVPTPRAFVAACILTLPAAAGTFTAVPFTGAADSGIFPDLTYTSRADFVGDGTRTINGVAFPDTGIAGTNYLLDGTTQNYTGFVNAIDGGSGSMNAAMSDFRYTNDGTGNASLTLTGLTPGQTYVTSWYSVGFGPVNGRNVVITDVGSGTSFHFDENYRGGGNGNVLRYTFTATSSTQTYTFDADGDGDSFHHYAFTNAVATQKLVTTPTVTAVRGTAGQTFAPFTVSNDDLLQTHVANVNFSSGNFAQENTGGVPIFNNGKFSITGLSQNNPELATVGNDQFVEFTLDTVTNPFGYDITSLQAYGGWNDNGRDRQTFKLSYSLVGSSDYVYLGAVDFNPTDADGVSAVKAVFDTALTNVDGIRIDFFGGQENSYTGFGELDAIGTASVPEPGAFAALIGGAAVLLLKRRRA